MGLLNMASSAQTTPPPPPLSSPDIQSAEMKAWQKATVSAVAPNTEKHSIHSYFNANPESPDGKYVLYFSSTAANGEFGDICILERATGKETVLAKDITTEDAHRVACQQWADGGKYVAFHDYRDGKWSVKSVEVVTGREKTLAEERLLCFGAPDSKWMSLYGYHWKHGAYRDFEMVNVETGEIKTVATVKEMLERYGNEIRELIGEGEVSIFFPVISADGKKAMFKVARGSGEDNFRTKKASERLGKFIYDIENKQWLGFHKFWGHPAWFHDGSAIIERGITVIYLDGKPARRFAKGCIGDHQSVSPDGKFFVADSGIEKRENGQKDEWAVCVGEFATEEYVLLHRFVHNNGARSWRQSHPHPVFSADGQRVYFNVSGGGWTRLYVAERAK
jgi:Tol biopolymer transport system component